MYYNCKKQLYSWKIITYNYNPNYLEDNFIPLESQSQANTSVTPSEPEGSKGKGKRHSEGLITVKKWTPIATQKSIKPQNFAPIQGKPTLISCTGKITIINPVVTSKGKFPKEADNKFVQGTVKDILASKGTNQRTEKACPEPEDLEEDTLDTVVDGKKMREIISALPFTLQFNGDLKPGDWKDMVQVLQLHQLFKDLFQWSMDNKRFNLASHWEELEASHERMKKLTASMDKIVKTLQEGHVQLSKASEETNKRLNLAFEEQHHSKRDRDCLDQDIK
ncbi:hypothetical protein O181_087317 [Austropuccinia psidii MF-1]|uniref:Uncharacterized protein n=1 Tax=Austropuccinia psidii MF-1 TaxID=1389203 RepID=A0A9Q3IPF6_9BASI|nr:hypothetical protein [Austropuccinia psidii MF-1]